MTKEIKLQKDINSSTVNIGIHYITSFSILYQNFD